MSLFDTVTRASLPDFPFLGLNTVMDVNAMRSAATLKDVTLYTSPYLVASNKGYTKHYYAGTNLLCKPSAEPNLFELCRGAAKNVEQREKRICAKIGSGGLNASTPFISTNQLLQDKVSSLFEKCRVQMEQRTLPDIGVSCIGRANGSQEPTLQMDVDPVGKKVIAIVGFKPDYFEDAMKASLSPTGTETAQYFYHSDHLGSASWITDASGTPVQHLQYCPFGEPFVNQHTGTYQERFTFTGKERDEETGYGYFGARYLDADLLTGWLSVDPMADKYPSLSPYNYCAWNPVKLVDLDGRDIILPKGTSTKDVYIILVNLQKLTNDKLYYKTQKDGTIKIGISSLAKSGSETKVSGTNLIRRINSSDQTMTIQITSAGSGNSETDVNSTNAINGNGSDVNVYFDPTSNPNIMTEDPKTGNVSGKNRPNQVGLAHEMIHGDRSMRGNAIDYSQNGTNTYKNASGNTVIQTVPKEEIATVGLGYNKKGDITENQIRKEQGQNKRGAY